MIEVLDSPAGSPGRSGADAFAAACRRSTAPLAVVAREGYASSITPMVQAQLVEAFASRPAMLAVGLVARPQQRDAMGIEFLARPEPDLWPAAVAMDMRRCALVLGRMERSEDDPWLEVVDRLGTAGGAVAWAVMPASVALLPRPWPPVSSVPPLASALPVMTGADGWVPADPPPDPAWVSLWGTEDGADPQLSVGPERPGPEWRHLGDLLSAPAPGGAPLVRRRVAGGCDSHPERASDGDEILGWLRATGVPGDVALMLCADPGGRESVHPAEDVPPGLAAVRLLGWARAERSHVVSSELAVRAAVTPVTIGTATSSDTAWLDSVHRPGTRAVFRSASGGLSFAPGATDRPCGYVRVSPGDGRAPVIVDGRAGGYAMRSGLRGAPATVGDPVDDYVPIAASAMARAKRRAGREVRARRADPRRLLLVLPWLTIGGADIFITALARELSSRGFEVHVALTYPGAESPGDHRNLIMPHVQGLTCVPEAHPGQPLPQVLSTIGRRARVGQMIICGGWQAYAGLPGLRAALPGTRVLDILFNDVGHIASNRLMSRWIDLTVCAYDGLRDLLVQGYGESPGRATTIYIGIDPERFRPAPVYRQRALKQEIGADPAQPLWGYAGRLSDEKCIPDLIAALDLMGPDAPANVLVQGDGPARHAVEQAVVASGRHIIVRPFQDDQLPTLQALDAYILPSRTEGIPLALMEAAACGAVPIATAVGGVPDLVVPGVTGYLAQPERPGSLAAAMISAAYTCPGQWAEMAFRARQRVRQTMSWSHTVDRYVEVLTAD